MRSFVAACIVAIALAAVGAIALDRIQEPVNVAFTTVGVRL